MKILLLLFTLATGVCMAQSPERSFRIVYFDAPSTAPRELILFDGKDSQKVELPKMNFSPVYRLRAGTNAVALLNTAPETIADVPPAAPRITIPEEVTEFYLFISTDSENPVAPVQMSLVDAATDRFEAGQMLWFNLTDNTIGGKLGRERIVVKPRSRHVMDAPASEAGSYSVELAYQAPNKDRPYPICQTKWIHSPGSRNVAFVYKLPGVRAPKVAVFRDHRESWNDSTQENSDEG